ncbi:outer membrane transport/efflux protein [Formosa agariphila KMM 3901]|uniref:Outer membrane transport/efflux protein n=1 Tax=Formosa agariphila (strain DSM 15362 / KCTC 12365 / LMG 23005 / KMM 3901 / M-2Alg 35-1) TaxID=1347342 RepID=T2KGR2_FORAG|nr:TolC family protein [Formosa agariphila]CDF77965.1 outer membrane transport/efflux protein [Formosa agariphila KMM 3901]
MKKITLLGLFLFSVMFTYAQDNKQWTLEECVNYALENNISIKQSELDTDLAGIDKSDAVMNFLPTVNANASYNINTGANVNPATNQFENQTFRSASGGVNSGVNLFSGLQNWKALQRSKINIIASQYQLDKMKDDISIFVANAFVQILYNKEQIKVLNAQNKITKENLERTNELVDAGVLPKGDVLEIKATDATQIQQIIAAENDLFISKIGLAQLLKIEDYQTFDIADEDYGLFSDAILEENPSAIIEKAKEEVYDVKVAETNLELAQKDLELSRTQYYPQLTAFMGYSTRWSSTNLDFITGQEMPFIDQLYTFDGTSMGLQLSVPIFNGLSVRNNVRRNQVNVERSKYLLEQANLDLESEVYQAYNDAKNAKKSFEAATQTSEARKLAFEYAEERYTVGLTNAFDFSQASINYENAQSEVVRTKYEYIFKVKVLEFYFGIPIDQINYN